MPSEPKTGSYVVHPRQAASQFVKGVQSNPNLKTMSNRDMAQARINAKSALRIRAMLLDTLEARIATQYDIIYNPDATDEEREEAQKIILKLVNADVNTMLRDSETRGLGAPKQEVTIVNDKSLKDMTDDELEGIILEGEFNEIEDQSGH